MQVHVHILSIPISPLHKLHACVSKYCGIIVYTIQHHVTMPVTVTVPAHTGVT